MALRRQVVDIPFGQGVDQKTGKALVMPGKLLVANNVRFDKLGTVEPRLGITSYNSLTIDGSLTSTLRLIGHENELLAIDGANLLTQVFEDNIWSVQDKIPEAKVKRKIDGERGKSATNAAPDLAYLSGYFCETWTDGTYCYARLFESASGARLDVLKVSGSLSKVVAIDTWFYVFIYASNHVTCYGFDLDDVTAGWGLIGDLASDVDYQFDVCVSGTGAANKVFMVYKSTSTASPTMVIHDYASGMALSKSDTRTADIAYTGTTYMSLAIAADTANLWITWNDNSGSPAEELSCAIVSAADIDNDVVSRFVVDSDTLAAGGTSKIERLAICRGSGTQALIVYEIRPISLECAGEVRAKLVLSTGSVSTKAQAYHISLSSRPLAINGTYYFVAQTPITGMITTAVSVGGSYTPLQNNVWLLTPDLLSNGGEAWGTFRVAARFACSKCGRGSRQNVSSLVVGSTATLCSVAIQMDEKNLVDPGDVFSVGGFDIYELEFKPVDAWMPAYCPPEVAIAGGYPASYDGTHVSEIGFHQTPICGFYSAVSSTGSNAWQYCAVYKWTDRRGVVHRSLPSAAVTWSTASTPPSGTVYCTALTLTERQDADDNTYPVIVEFYRTVANGSTFYYLGETDNSKSTIATSLSESTPVTDAVLQERATLYTTGEVLENVAPPCPVHMAYHAGRLWVVSSDDPNVIWYSKTIVEGEAPGFSEALTVRVPSDEPIIGIANLDDALIIFKKSSTWVMFGSGPNDLGQGNDLTEPQCLSRSVGLRDARTIVQYPEGLMWCAAAGIYAMNRNRQIQYVGGPIEDTLATYTDVTSATCVEAYTEVRFTARTNVTATAGCVFVWNYLVGQWSIWELRGLLSGTNYGMASGCVARRSGVDTWHACQGDGVVVRERAVSDASSYRDHTGTYTMKIETAWLHLAGLQGYQRVRHLSILGEYVTSHKVDLNVYYNYDDDSYTDHTWTAAQIVGIKKDFREQLRLHVPLQKCESIKAEIIVTPDTSVDLGQNGMMVRLQGLSLEVGLMSTTYHGLQTTNNTASGGGGGESL